MNWEAIGAVAEAIGAAGVILTLGYLAIQIRRSNLLATAESHRFYQQVATPAIMGIAQDPELARIFREGLANRDSLPVDDRIRFDMLMGQLVGGLTVPINDEAILGHRGDSQTLGNRASIRRFLTTPGGASWWTANMELIAPKERETIEELLSPHEPPAT